MSDQLQGKTNQSPPSFLDQNYFEDLSRSVFKLLKPKEHLFLSLSGESSQFVRLNAAQVRQIGTVEDALIELSLVYESQKGQLKKCNLTSTLTGLSYEDRNRLESALSLMRTEVVQLPDDPYAQLPQSTENSSIVKAGHILPPEQTVDELLRSLPAIDIAGIYASGPIARGMANSAGQKHWFYTENFAFDYSLYTRSQRALKGTFAGTKWDSHRYREDILSAQEKLAILEKNPIRISRGQYRTYLAPEAVADLLMMFSWGAIGEAAIQQGESPLRRLRTGEKKFSPLFTLIEDFQTGETPRFNSEGELAPEVLPLIQQGKLIQSLVSSRSAKEYLLPSNQASTSESLRAPKMTGGNLHQKQILEELNTGLYLSNLHYLNWSDQPGGRITGMTRYACFWVEDGKIIAPIENMRFDESIFHLFGESLLNLTQTPNFIPEVSTYYMRNTGGVWCPGMLVSQMDFTI